jgi:hypothetical protein
VDLSGSEEGPLVDPCEHSNEPSGYTKDEEFID